MLAYSLISVFIISILSLLGVISIFLKEEKLKKILIYLVSFSVGAFFGDILFHLLPEAVEEFNGFTLGLSLSLLSGFIIFFTIEKVIHWRHCHIPTSEKHPHPLALMNLIGDSFHNFLDGIIIGASFMVDMKLGIITSVAVILHEIPQELGDFGVLLHAKFTKKKAILFNFLVSLFAILGVLIVFLIGNSIDIGKYLIPFSAGGFLYIATVDLIPELKEECEIKKIGLHLLAILLGIGIMFSLIFLE